MELYCPPCRLPTHVSTTATGPADRNSLPNTNCFQICCCSGMKQSLNLTLKQSQKTRKPLVPKKQCKMETNVTKAVECLILTGTWMQTGVLPLHRGQPGGARRRVCGDPFRGEDRQNHRGVWITSVGHTDLSWSFSLKVKLNRKLSGTFICPQILRGEKITEMMR